MFLYHAKVNYNELAIKLDMAISVHLKSDIVKGLYNEKNYYPDISHIHDAVVWPKHLWPCAGPS